MILDPLLKAATSHAESVKVTRTGISPLLWVVGLMALPALVLSAWIGQGWLSVAYFCFAGLLTFIAIGAYFVLLFARPEMLQSEEYRLRRDALLMIYKHGASPQTLKVTSELARLESGTSRKRNEEKQ